MREPAVGLILLSSILWAPAVAAASAVTVEALQAPVTMQRGGSETALSAEDEIRVDDRLSTGGSGRLALRVEPGARVQLDVDTVVEVIALAQPGAGSDANPPAVTVQRGRACVQFDPGPDSVRRFYLRFGDAVSVIVYERGQVCGDYTDGLSSIVLAAGTVQIANAIEAGTVILSEAGSEYRFDDSGYFELGRTDARLSIEVRNDVAAPRAPSSEDAGISPSPAAADSAAVASDAAAGVTTQAAAPAGPATVDATPSDYVYTVYLFSTLSAENADALNRRLRDAGYPTEILTSEGDDAVRYRIAASGFTSRQAAQEFSTSIVGKHGIRDSWIGRSKATQ